MDENEGIGGDYLKGGVGFEIHGQILRIREGFETGREEGRGEALSFGFVWGWGCVGWGWVGGGECSLIHVQMCSAQG